MLYLGINNSFVELVLSVKINSKRQQTYDWCEKGVNEIPFSYTKLQRHRVQTI